MRPESPVFESSTPPEPVPYQRAMPRFPSWLPTVALWSLVVLSAVGVVRHLDVDPAGDRHLFHPEAIYPLAMWADLEAGAEIGQWSTPYAPYYFPDAALFWLAWRLTAEPVKAVYVFGLLQFLIFAWLAAGALGASVPIERRAQVRHGILLAMSWIAIAVWLGWDGDGRWLQLWVGAFHSGAVLLMMAGLWAVQRACDGSRAAMVALGVLTAVGVGSDRLLLPLLVLPVIVIWGFRPFKPGLWGVMIFSSALGSRLPAWVEAAGGPRTPVWEATFEGLGGRLAQLLGREDALLFVWHRFFEQFGLAYKALFVLWLGGSLWQAWRAPTTSVRRLHGFVLCSSFITLGATAYVGLQVYGPRAGSAAILFVPRYLLALYIWPALTLWLLPRPIVVARRLFVAAWVTTVILVLGLWLLKPHPGGFPTYRPSESQCLDDLARQHGLKAGLMYFHRVQRVNVFSRAGLHVDQVTDLFHPITWIDNKLRAEHEPGFEGYDFVLLRGIRDREEVAKVLGQPTISTGCLNSEVWIYSPPRRPRWEKTPERPR